MPQLFSSFASRLREYVGDRRRSLRRRPRFVARLPLTVAPLGADEEAGDDFTAARSIGGFTRDLSETGLTLLLPAVRVGSSYLTDSENYLGVRLETPGGPVRILAAPARFEQLSGDDEVAGYLLGARIVSMKEDERDRYLSYLDTLVRRGRRTRDREAAAAPAPHGARQTGVWESVTPVYVTEAFEKFLRESVPPRRS